MNDRRNDFIINLMKVWDRTRIELATPESAVRHASVARLVTDCATRPGVFFSFFFVVYLKKKKVVLLFVYFCFVFVFCCFFWGGGCCFDFFSSIHT